MSPGLLCSPSIESPPCRSRSRDQMGHVALGTLPPFTMQDSDFPAMGGASLESRNSGPLQVRTKMQAQHAAAALSGSRSSSSLKCVVESTLQYTMPHNPPQVQDARPSLPCPCLRILRTPSLQRPCTWLSTHRLRARVQSRLKRG